MDRRNLLMTGLSGIALVACAKLPTVPVSVSLPPELTTLIDDANSIYTKISSLGLPAGASSVLDEIKAAVSSISASTVVADAKAGVSALSTAWAAIKPYLPSSVSSVVTAVETVLPIALKVVGLVSMFALSGPPTGMTVAQARAILHS